MPMPARLKDIPAEQYTQPQKDFLAKVSAARGRIPVPLKIWLQSPTLAQAIEPLSTMLNTRSVLLKCEWELAVILIAQRWGSASVLEAHYKFMRASGVSEEMIQALQERREPPFDTERQKAVYKIASACDRRAPVDDAAFEHAEKALGSDGLAELIAFLGYYTSISLAMKIYSAPETNS